MISGARLAQECSHVENTADSVDVLLIDNLDDPDDFSGLAKSPSKAASRP